MKKIALSAITVAALGVTLIATEVHVDANDQVLTTESGFFSKFDAKGDLRLRQETVEKEGKSDVNHQRYRFRYSLNVDVTDNITLETAISSGKYNPTSGNVTFKDDDNIQDYFIDELKIDIVDIKYSFGDSWIRVGKQADHIYKPLKTQLVWDNDLRFEGVNYGYKNDSAMIRVGANRVHREKGHKDGDDINMFLAQYVHTQKLDIGKVNLGGAYYHYDDVKGNTDPYGSLKGNSSKIVDGVKVYQEDYGIVEAFAELQVKDLVMGLPFKTAFSLAYNALASHYNFAYDLSAQLGSAKEAGEWEAAVTYRDIQKDAVFGAHNDSDFSGGGTDSSGYSVKAKYKFANNVDVAGWWHWSKLGDAELDYHRIQLDVILKF